MNHLRPAVALLIALACCEGDDPVTNPGPVGPGADAGTAEDVADVAQAPDAKAPVVVAELLPAESIQTAEGLNLQLKGANVKLLDEPAGVWLVPFAFRSHIWHGNAWDHPAVLYVPQVLAPDGASALVVMQQGTPDLDAGVDVSIDDDFGAGTAALLGLPVLVLGQVPDDTIFNPKESPPLTDAFPDCFNRLLQQKDLDDCATLLTLESANPKWSLTVAMARTYLRAITAVAELPAALQKAEVAGIPVLAPARVVLAGAGRRGRALWLAGAADTRVKGLFVAGADAGDLPAFWALVRAVSAKAAEQQEADRWAETLAGPLGVWWRSMDDPATLAPSLAGRAVLIARGTNDPVSPLGATALYAPTLDARTALVDGYGLGVATGKHLEAYQGFVASVLAGRPHLRLTAAWTSSGAFNHTVEALLEAEGGAAPTVSSVKAWYTDGATLDDADLRDATWASVDLTPNGTDPQGRPRYKGAVQAIVKHWAGYVELRTVWQGVPALITTTAHVAQ
ncbi:MAG: hypothetical protein AMXMBFR64_24200 [Myxococcales bacterium]